MKISFQSRFVQYGIIFLFASFYVGIPFLSNQSKTLRRFSDYDVRLSWFTFAQNELRELRFPLFNPYFGEGIHLMGDYVHFTYHPFVLISLLFFSPETTIKLLFFITVLFSGLIMREILFLTRCSPLFILWGSLLYLTNGALASRFYAGHIDFWTAFVFFPLIFYVAIKKEIYIKHSLILAICFLFLFWGDNVYMVLYSLLLFICARIFSLSIRIIHEKINNEICIQSISKITYMEIRAILVMSIIFLIGISPRLISFFTTIAPIFYRAIHEQNIASIQLPITLLQFIVPFQEKFYMNTLFIRLFGFNYEWYEYYAFITPFPFLLFIGIKKHISHQILILLLLIPVGLLFISQTFQYSPFYLLQLVPVLNFFRAPMRMSMPLIAIITIIAAYGGTHLFNKISESLKGILLIGIVCSVMACFFISIDIIHSTFTTLPNDYEQVANYIKTKGNINSTSVLLYACCMQSFLMNNKIHMINYYHGWFNKNLLPYYEKNISFLSTNRPRYIIYEGNKLVFKTYGYKLVYKSGLVELWEHSKPTVTPQSFIN